MKHSVAFSMRLVTRFSLIFVLCATAVEKCHALKNITLGVFVPMSGWAVGNRLASAAPIAINDINKDPNILPDYHVDFVWRDSGCSPTKSAGGTVEFLKQDIAAIIGPYCSKGCVAAGHIVAYYKVPMLTYSCSEKALSDKKVYPTVARTYAYARTNEVILLNNTVQLMRLYNWKIFTIIVEIDEVWKALAEYFQKNYNVGAYAADNLIMEIIYYNPDVANKDDGDDAKNHILKILNDARKKSRSEIFDCFPFSELDFCKQQNQ